MVWSRHYKCGLFLRSHNFSFKYVRQKMRLNTKSAHKMGKNVHIKSCEFAVCINREAVTFINSGWVNAGPTSTLKQI